MNFIFRSPKFPVIVDTGEMIFQAKTKAQLVARLSKLEFTDEAPRDIIDSAAEGFVFYPKSSIVSPSISMRRWTKMKIIDLYNTKRAPGSPELRAASLGSRSLQQIVSEAVALLSRAPI